MFIYNLKINKNKFMKIFVGIVLIVSIVLVCISINKLLKYSKTSIGNDSNLNSFNSFNNTQSSNSINSNNISKSLNNSTNSVIFYNENSLKNEINLDLESSINIDENNFISFLEDSNNNIEKYVGKQINISGFVYRIPEFKENQFIIARTMIINSNEKDNAVIVGILAECENAKNFDDNTLITCTGEIKKGNIKSKGEIPILKITNINNLKK